MIFVNYNKIMEKVTLIKDGQKREFSSRAAQIAIDNLGWTEFQPFPTPVELNNGVHLNKVLPPLITKPREIVPEYPGDEKIVEVIPDPIVEVPVKKTRKSPIRSKSANK